MRTFGILLVFAFVAYFTTIEAHIQQNCPASQKIEEKIYVSSENLHFEDERIFWRNSQDTWVPISGVDCDSNGIYLTGSRVISWSYYECTTCRRRYARPPSECDGCQGTSFEPVYEDIWDRRA